MDRDAAYGELMRMFPGLMAKSELLSKHTTIKIGGCADLFCELHSTGTLLPLLHAALNLQVPAVIIGGGSNLLVDDRGYKGLIVKFINHEPPGLEFPLLTVSAGNSLKEVLDFAADHSLSGLEFLAGIPGSVGGAVYMNAGAYGKTISEIVHSAVIINDKYDLQTVKPEFFQFSYRSSVLQVRPETVVSLSLKVSRGDSTAIRNEYERILSLRAGKHPKPSIPNAGSYFKNLPPEHPGGSRRPAGYFLEKAGAKTMKVGDAAVYSGHANIIINTGNASAQDVLRLAQKMKEAVYKKHNIILEEEVRFLDSEKGIIQSDKSAE